MSESVAVTKNYQSIELFFDEIDRTVSALGFEPGEECWYRGHSNNKYLLLPSLMRAKAGQKKRSKQEIEAKESDIYWEFRTRATALNLNAGSGWDFLFHMRHHAAPTRLLDWTDTVGNALYFALRDYEEGSEKTPCIWLLNAYALNELSTHYKSRELHAPQYLFDSDEVFFDAYSDIVSGGTEIYWEKPIALYPEYRNSRLHAQRGYFTIHGTDHRPIDEMVPGLVRRIDIPNQLIPSAKKFLARAGINEYSLFPDLDGLARHLSAQHGYS